MQELVIWTQVTLTFRKVVPIIGSIVQDLHTHYYEYSWHNEGCSILRKKSILESILNRIMENRFAWKIGTKETILQESIQKTI